MAELASAGPSSRSAPGREAADAERSALAHAATQAKRTQDAAQEEEPDETLHRGLVESIRGQPSRRRATDSDDDGDGGDVGDDELFEQLERELEEDDGPGGLRERRMEQLREELASLQAQKLNTRHGRLIEPINEKDLMKHVAENKAVVVHFYKADFQRCRIMDNHLEFLAPLHPSTLFAKISVFAAPFLVTKLSVQTLPCLVCFKEGGKVADRIVGFEELGNKDNFGSAMLEWRLGRAGVLVPRSEQARNQPILGFADSQGGRAAAGGVHDDNDDLDL